MPYDPLHMAPYLSVYLFKKNPYWICYHIASVVCFDTFGHEAYGILAPWAGIKATLPALEGEVLTTGPPGKPPEFLSWLLAGDTSFLWSLSIPFLLMVSSEARDLSRDANRLHGCLFPGNWDTFQSSLLLPGLILRANLGPGSITSCQATWHSTWLFRSLGGSWIVLYQTLVWYFSVGDMLSLPTAPPNFNTDL